MELSRDFNVDLRVWRPCPINVSLPYPPLYNIRVMVIVWRLRGNIIRTAPCWVV